MYLIHRNDTPVVRLDAFVSFACGQSHRTQTLCPARQDDPSGRFVKFSFTPKRNHIVSVPFLRPTRSFHFRASPFFQMVGFFYEFFRQIQSVTRNRADSFKLLANDRDVCGSSRYTPVPGFFSFPEKAYEKKM